MAKARKVTITVINKDPWVHRSAGMKCVTCVFFVPKTREDGKAGTLGRCRNASPTMRGYPAVFETDWCGQHRLDENKIPPKPE